MWYSDIEDIQDAIVDVLKADLDTEIKAVVASKPTKVTATEIPDLLESSFYDSLDRNISESFFILYGIEGTNLVQAGNDTQTTVRLAFIGCLTSSDDPSMSRKLLRIQKALENVLKDVWRKTIKNDTIITQTEPLLLVDDNGSYTRAGGVIVEITI